MSNTRSRLEFVRVLRASGPRASGVMPDTGILTLDGVIPVEHLTYGDRIVTRDGGARLLRGIVIRLHDALRPCVIDADVLGHGSPSARLSVAPDQPILLRGWRALALYGGIMALVPAKRLVDGRHVVQAEKARPARCFTLLFDSPQIVYADGSEIAMLDPNSARP